MAGAVAALLALVTAVLVLVGVLLTPWLIAVIAPGFERREARGRPSGWCGSCSPAPGCWCSRPGASACSTATGASSSATPRRCCGTWRSSRAWWRSGGGRAAYRLAEIAAWGSVVGQPAPVRRAAAHGGSGCSSGIRPRLERGSAQVARGAAQLRAGVRRPRRGADQRLRRHRAREPAAHRRRGRAVLRAGALHPAGEPVRHVGLGGRAARDVERARAARPSARRTSGPGWRRGCARSRSSWCRRRWRFLALGDVVAGALYQTGAFTRGMTVYVWGILAGSAVGLLASTMGRLYASTFYALHDTRTPLRFAVLRVALTIGLGYLFALPLPRALGVEAALGRGRAHRLGRHRRLDRVPAAAPRAQRADRRHRPAGPPDRAALGRRRPGGRRAWALEAGPAGGAPDPGRPRRPERCTGRCIFCVTDRLGIPEARAVMRRLRPGEPRTGAAG